MDIFAEFRRRIRHILEGMVARDALPATLDLDRFVVEPPRDATHGDLACNAAMVYAREAAPHFKNPRQFATALAAAITDDPDVDSVEVAGPGFLNLRLRPHIWAQVLQASLMAGEAFGRGDGPSEVRSVNIEYVSANPTGPMHVGHGRGAVFGDALGNLLAFAGAPVTREYYINDAGAQVDVLARSAFLRYRQALGEEIGAIPEGLYPGDYLKGVGAALAERHGRALLDQGEATWLPVVRDAAIDAMMAMIKGDLASLGITHEVFFSERSLTVAQNGINAVERAVELLRAKDLIYRGRLPPPKGQLPEDWEDREQTLFRSTAYGDDVDRPLQKSDGSYTYFASDIAYHKTKIDRGFGVLIDVLGADHGGYVKRMTAAVAALSDRTVSLDCKLCQLVKLLRDGEPVKMSKRSGDFVTLREVVDEVGRDAVRFMMLFRKNDAPLDFDLAKVIDQSKENPVFYVQYGHARGRSVLRQATAAFPDLDLSPGALARAPLELIADESEIGLVKLIAQFPRIVESAATAHEPHRIAFYLHDLSSAFHAHWNRGKDNTGLRFINEEQRDLTHARVALVTSFTMVIKAGLGILGVKAPDEMR